MKSMVSMGLLRGCLVLSIGIGAAHGTGHVYARGARIGWVTMNQLSVGLRLGGEGYSQIIFFETKDAMD